MKPNRTAIGYARVSTGGQAVDGVSLDAQQARVAAWCAANGYQLAAMFVDAGLSGARADNRPELQRALTLACKGKSALVVYSLSRLARSTKDTINIAEQLDAAGADLVSLSERIDTTSAAGRMVFRMLAVLSEFERDLVSERTASALAHKRSKGERVGNVPFGYEVAPDGVRLVEVPAEQATVAVIQTRRGRGETYRAIAAHLNGKGVPAKGGGRWHPQAVLNVCKRRPEA
jgi:DNA invertase Pin-like site-specific DNA recombinase